ncbi:MAG: DHH family phosphoesterase [Brevinema sp.]
MYSIQDVYDLVQLLKNGHHIRIISHRNPDADAVGSIIAFTEICKFYHLTYEIMVVDSTPKKLSFLTKGVEITHIDPEDLDDLQNEQTDLVVFLDCGQLNRAGILGELLLPHQKIINIDHHTSNPLFGDLNIVVDISSTCELLYHLIISLNIPLTKHLSTCLYVGILTDTGMFQYDKVTPMTHYVVAHLLEYNIDHFYLYQHIYQDNPVNWLALLKKGLENLQLLYHDSVAIITFSHQELYPFDDIHLLFPIIMSTDSIKLCAILKEKEDSSISVSLRSKDTINVATIAQVFGGGGHIHAAGCRTTKHTLLEFKKIIYTEIEKHLS